MIKKYDFLHIIYSYFLLLLCMAAPLQARRSRKAINQSKQAKNKELLQIKDENNTVITTSVENNNATIKDIKIESPSETSKENIDENSLNDDSARSSVLTPTPTPEIKKATPGFPPPPLFEEPLESIEFNFQEADLLNVIKQMEVIFESTFLTDDIVQPARQGSKPVKGNKITFKTEKALSRTAAWNLFLSFLDLAGFNMTPTENNREYRIRTFELSRKSTVPTFIDTPYTELPDSDQIVRYMHFLKNISIGSIEDLINSWRSSVSLFAKLESSNAFVLTDKSVNIKTIMQIITELDKTCSPQTMSVVKLYNTDPEEVKKIYDTIMPPDTRTPAQMLGQRKQSNALYFPDNTVLIPEPTSNSVIIIGSKSAVQKVEEFITKFLEDDSNQNYAPIWPYRLKYAKAESIARIMSDLTAFGKSTPAGAVGGVRGPDKYLKPMLFVAEKETNTLLIKSDYTSYMTVLPIIEKLDEVQPQIAVEILILSITKQDINELGSQIRSKESSTNGLATANNFLGKNIKFQTSGLRAGSSQNSIVENQSGPGVQRLLGNLLNLLTATGPANTVLTLGEDIFGVWGVVQALKTVSNLRVVNNPFLTVTNKTKGEVSIGEVRRIQSSQVFSGDQAESGQDDTPANLTVNFTPQINSDGMVILDFKLNFTEFTNPPSSSANDLESANRVNRVIETVSTLADGELLAFGGITTDRIIDSQSSTPFLDSIPLLGWLFKNKKQEKREENLLVLVSTKIISPESQDEIKSFTQKKIDFYENSVASSHPSYEKRDPINRTFFKKDELGDEITNKFFNKRDYDTEIHQAFTKNALNSLEKQKNTPLITNAESIFSKKRRRRKGRLKNITIETPTLSTTCLNQDCSELKREGACL